MSLRACVAIQKLIIEIIFKFYFYLKYLKIKDCNVGIFHYAQDDKSVEIFDRTTLSVT